MGIGNMFLFQTLLGTAGSITGLCALLAPVPTFAHIIQARSADKHSCWPYLCSLLACNIWAFYGMPAVANSASIMVINIAGSFIEAGYCVVFLVYTHDAAVKRQLAMSLAALVAFFAGGAAFVLTSIPAGSRGALVGLVADLTSVLATASPLAAVRSMVQTQNVQFFPIALCVMNLANTGIWTLFGIATLDVYVTVPNLAGVTLSGMQVFFYLLYRRNNLTKLAVMHVPEVDATPLLSNYVEPATNDEKLKFAQGVVHQREQGEENFEQHWEGEDEELNGTELNDSSLEKELEVTERVAALIGSLPSAIGRLKRKLSSQYWKLRVSDEITEKVSNHEGGTIGSFTEGSGWRSWLR